MGDRRRRGSRAAPGRAARAGSGGDALRRVDALVKVALRIARSTRSGRVALGWAAAAIEPEWIPDVWEDVAEELAAAREASRDQLPPQRVERILRDAWGVRPGEELDDLEPEPVAVTPAAQVHRGVLDGAPVAVKVLRPGLTASVRQDLTLLEGLAGPLRAAFPALDPAALLGEVRERVLDELDLEHEATVQRQFHRALRRHPFLSVPAPASRLAREQVLVSEWADGVPLRHTPRVDEAAARLVVFVLGAARFGLVPADLGPDDVLARPDGRLAIVDLGATGKIAPHRIEAGAEAVEALAAGDPDALGAALESLDALPANRGSMALAVAAHALGPHLGSAPSRLDREAVIAVRDRVLERPEALADLLVTGAIAPADLWPARGAAQLFATIARAGATGSWLELVRMALRHGWDAIPE